MNDITASNPQETWSRRLWWVVKWILIVGLLGALLIAMLLPAGCYAPQAARRSTCKNNLKQIGLALHNYHDTHNCFPPGALSKTSYGWSASLLPFLDEDPLAGRIDLAAQPMALREDVEGEAIYTFRCPSSEAPVTLPNNTDFDPYANSAYRGVAGYSLTTRDGVLFEVDADHPSTAFRDITDGSSNTIMVAETHLPQTWEPDGPREMFVIWAGTNGRLEHTLGSVSAMPNSHAFDAFGSPHEGGMQALLADGSVRFLANDISSDVYRHLGQRSDGNPVGDF